MKTSAFTLIELLVVVAIIAVLAAMLMPVITLVRSAARTVVCGNNQRGIGIALLTIANEDSGLLPWGNFGPTGMPFNWISAVTSLDEQIRLTCSDARIKAGSNHYTSNMQVLSRCNFGYGPWRQVTTGEAGTNVVMLFDGGQQASGDAFPSSENMGLTFFYLDNPSLPPALQNDTALPIDTSGTFKVDNRHSGLLRANFLYGDGHVQCQASTAMTNRDFRITSGGRHYW